MDVTANIKNALLSGGSAALMLLAAGWIMGSANDDSHQPQRLVAVHKAIVMARHNAQQQSPTLRHDNRTGPSEIAVGDEH